MNNFDWLSSFSILSLSANHMDSVFSIDTRMRLFEMQAAGLPESIVNELDNAGAFDCLRDLWEQIGTSEVLVLDVLAEPLSPSGYNDKFHLHFVSTEPIGDAPTCAVRRLSDKTVDGDDPNCIRFTAPQSVAAKNLDKCVRRIPASDILCVPHTKMYGCVFLSVQLLLPPSAILGGDAPNDTLMECEPWLSRRITKHGLSSTRTDTPFARCTKCNSVYATEKLLRCPMIPTKCRCV